MKRNLFSILATVALLIVTMHTNAQSDYNKWSLDLKGGIHKPAVPFASGYHTDTPSFWQGSLGVRYMFNNYFGLRADFGYSSLEGGDNSNEFKSDYMRSTLQGVVNAGNLLNFNDWTNTIGLLVHAGIGYSMNKPSEPIEFDDADQMMNVMVGISPQFRLGNRVALTTDVSLFTHSFQDHTWDGTAKTNRRGFQALAINTSIGLSFYLGGNDVHADWYSVESQAMSELEELDQRLTKVETDMIDSDQDGVADYLDREPNTPSGVAVDTKGRAIDTNNNGIPDELESSLDQRYASREAVEAMDGGSGKGTIKDLINNGYVNVYFKFDSTEPEVYSLQSVNYLILYMKENPSAKAELIGYADEIGNPEYNQSLSEQRAKKVNDLLVDAGISQDRINYRGGGEDDSVNKDSSNARQLVRRVTFRLQ